jgi:hypothetical protein
MPRNTGTAADRKAPTGTPDPHLAAIRTRTRRAPTGTVGRHLAATRTRRTLPTRQRSTRMAGRRLT